MIRFGAWNVFRQGMTGQTGWTRQQYDPEPRPTYDAVLVGGGP